MTSPHVTAPKPTGPVPLGQIAVFIGVIVLALNGLFFVLSRRYELAQLNAALEGRAAFALGDARITFAVFTGSVGGAAMLAAISSRVIGHVFAAVFGVGAFVCGAIALVRGMPGALSGALLILGALMPILTWRSLTGNRAAWSFLTVICGVLGLCMLFGAPKVRTIFGIGLWSAMILPGLLVVTAVALAMVRGNYQTTSTPTAD